MSITSGKPAAGGCRSLSSCDFSARARRRLLNPILKVNHDLRVAVLVNDLGSVNIEAELVVGLESDLEEVTSGAGLIIECLGSKFQSASATS